MHPNPVYFFGLPYLETSPLGSVNEAVQPSVGPTHGGVSKRGIVEAGDVGETPAGVPLRPTMPNRVDCLNPVQMSHDGCSPRWGKYFSGMLNSVNTGYISMDERDFADSVDSLLEMVWIHFAAHLA